MRSSSPVELGTHAAPAEDGRGLLDTVERVQIVGEALVGLGPRRDDQPRLAVGQVRPDLLGHVRHHRMEQLEEPLERGERPSRAHPRRRS